MKRKSDSPEPPRLAISTKHVGSVIQKIVLRGIPIHKDTGPQAVSEKPTKRTASMPSPGKVNVVLTFIKEHPGCKSADIIKKTDFSAATVERSLAALKQRGLITHSGSNKTGGYYAVEKREE